MSATIRLSSAGWSGTSGSRKRAASDAMARGKPSTTVSVVENITVSAEMAISGSLQAPSVLL